MADEVICGFGRVGDWFGTTRYGIEPDMMTLAKGITSAWAPLGAVVANERTIEQIREFVEVDSLSFLSLEGLLSAFKFPHKDACTACWSGHYKVPIDQPQTKFSFERDQLKMF